MKVYVGWALLIAHQNLIRADDYLLNSVHPETALKIPKLQLWTPNNGHLGVHSRLKFFFKKLLASNALALAYPNLQVWTPIWIIYSSSSGLIPKVRNLAANSSARC